MKIKINDTAALIAAGLSSTRFHMALDIVQLISPATEELETVNNYPMKDGSFMVSMTIDDAVAKKFYLVLERILVAFGVYFNANVPGKSTLVLAYNEALPEADKAFSVSYSFEEHPEKEPMNRDVIFDAAARTKILDMVAKRQADAKKELALARANAQWGIGNFVEDHPVATTIGVVAVVGAIGYGLWHWNSQR